MILIITTRQSKRLIIIVTQKDIGGTAATQKDAGGTAAQEAWSNFTQGGVNALISFLLNCRGLEQLVLHAPFQVFALVS